MRRRARPRPLLRGLIRALAGLVIVLLAGAGGGYLWLRTSLPQTTGRLALPGLHREVSVFRDADGVPHIFAADDHDAYMALGFVHAQDRLFQMDFQRRLGAGRLAEVLGAGAVGIDRTMRTLGLQRAAEASLASLSPEVRAALQAYADGVNGFLETRSGALPPEYYVLRTAPEPWRPADSLLWGRLMAITLSGNWRGEALRARLAQRLTPAQLRDWYADDNYAGAITLPTGIEKSDATDALFARVLAAMPDVLRPRLASNIWVVDGSHTKSGKPILANDPHLGFAAPGIWYLASITTPDLRLTGATVAGVPFHILGQNGAIAWGMTTTGADTQDLFVERLAPGNPDAYETPDGPRPFVTRTETIKVRDADDVTITVRETRHGPVISDAEPAARAAAPDQSVIALAATALRASDGTAEALYRLDRARNWDQFTTALTRFDSPMQNIFYADHGGTVGMLAAGLVPLRRSGDGFMPARGWDGSADWTGFIPFDDLPRRKDPVAGMLVNANNRLVGTDYPYFISREWDAPYRAERILERLRETPAETVASTEALQLDTVSPMTAELLPLLLDHAGRDERTTQARHMLAAWDGRMRRDRPEPLIFVAWLRALDRDLFADELGDLFPQMWDLHAKLIARTLRNEAAWCDDVTTPQRERCAAEVQRALEQALAALSEQYGSDMTAWRWGAAHQVRDDHPIFSRIPLLRDWADLALPADGGNDTVNRGAMRVADPREPFADVHGPGYRAVYDLADPAASEFVIATGESGNPLSPHYRDFLPRWRDGRYRKLAFDLDMLIASGVDRLVLAPQ
ncbi:MAG TPA: penicillin acylase family protein [Candidatus Sulfotelmatobacter sp.]|nr:penicillin acylase family protein [Candidatus Sulfotelmatobacter sp.]